MKKKRFVLMGLLIFTVVTCFAITGTYARYTSSVEGSDDAKVAKWAWNINGEDLAAGTTLFTMDLFSNSNLLDNDCSASETDVVSTDKVVAPGTCGKFKIALVNNSEVNAEYAYTLSTENNANIPIKFSTDKTTWKDISDFSVNATRIDAGDTVSGTDIYWKWDINGTDSVDTALGLKGTDKIKVKAALTLTQVD